MIGTPFISEDEVTQRKVDKLNKKPWEQEVRDEKGRKRLHGAFTGGFSAGYFNTVGTKEGWTTSQFRSSRTEKSSAAGNQMLKKKQDVMDFMDEEDIKAQMGDTEITSKTVNKDYLSTLQPKRAADEYQALYEDESFRSGYIGAASGVKEFLPQFNNLIGSMLMRESGFSEADYQLNGRNYDNSKDYNKTFFSNEFQDGNNFKNSNLIKTKMIEEMNKYYQGNLEFKDDYYGAGYIPLIEDEIFITKKNKESIKSDSKANGSKNIIRMDKFEDDEEFGFYTNSGATNKEKYNFEILDENYLNEKEKELKHKRFRDNMDTDLEMSKQKFIKSESKLHSVENLEFKMPVLPKDYNPFVLNYHNVDKEKQNFYNLESEINKLQSTTNTILIHDKTQTSFDEKFKSHQKLDANKRSEILDLELEINPKILESYNPYLQSKFTKAEVCDFKNINDNKLIYNPNENKILNKTNTLDNNNTYNYKTLKSAPSTLEQFNNYFHLKVNIPFKNDVSKIARFAKFVAEKEGLIMGDNTYNLKNNLMSALESKAEREQFEQLYREELLLRKQKQTSKAEIKNPQLSETNQMKDRIENIKSREIKREKTLWRPEKILCKRFKVKDPFENKINSVVGIKGDVKDYDRDMPNVTFKKGEMKYTMSNLQYQLFKQENSNFSAVKGENCGNRGAGAIVCGKDLKSANNDNNVFKVINAKTDINLFDEIFNE